MAKREYFSEYHPAVGFAFFASVLLFSMCWMHPLYLAITLFGASAYQIRLKGFRAAARSMRYLLPAAVLTALLNALLGYTGSTVLFSLPWGKAVSTEALLFGTAAAVMLISSLQWFACCSAVMSADKWLNLFGRRMPTLSLLLSMTARMLPLLGGRLRAMAEAQRSMGRETERGRFDLRLRRAVAMLSALISWSMESAVETADSMKSRGYGLPGRTSFAVYRLDRRSRMMLIWIICCSGILLVGWLRGGMTWEYYSMSPPAAVTPLSAGCAAVYLALCLTPTAVNLRCRRRRKRRERGGEKR